MLQSIKNILKHILPPPTRTLIRETESLRAEIHSSEQRHAAELESFRREQSELLRQLSTMQEQHFEAIAQSFLHETEALRAELHAAEHNHAAAMNTLQSELRTVEQRHATELETFRQEQAALIQSSLSAQDQQFDRIDTQLRTALSSFEQKNTSLLQRINQNERTILSRFESEKWASRYFHNSRLKPEDYERELVLWYREHTGKQLDLQNPKTFNEKIQWMKLYDSTPLKTRLSDKYDVRQWVSEKIGEDYLTPLLGVWNSFDEINFDLLPSRFVLKATHGCGWNIVVKDKATFDVASARKSFDQWFQRNYAFWGFELQYLNIPPRIVAEEYLENDNNDLYDYKVFCFGGKAESVMFLCQRNQGLKMAFYDLNWNKLPFTYNFPQLETDMPRPKNFDQLIRLAEVLAEGFPHVRVDFYVLNDGTIKFGEMTFTSADGLCRWSDPEPDLKYGSLIHLPPPKTPPTLVPQIKGASKRRITNEQP
ncbi:MAG: hypothetical protein IJB75_01575 [Oscillospiraceae bacterium]|nr:hypothetical protein [Oscillospiraceae bacterium]